MKSLEELREYSRNAARLHEIQELIKGIREYCGDDLNADSLDETIEEIASHVNELEAEKAALKKKLLEEEPAVLKCLEPIDDMIIRFYARLHYCRGYSWQEVAEIAGTNHNAVRQSVYRSFRKIGIQ